MLHGIYEAAHIRLLFIAVVDIGLAAGLLLLLRARS